MMHNVKMKPTIKPDNEIKDTFLEHLPLSLLAEKVCTPYMRAMYKFYAHSAALRLQHLLKCVNLTS
jgi:hypothetical protein